jgi:putative transposase
MAEGTSDPEVLRMPSTHTSLHYHLVFSTKERVPLINAKWRNDLHAYLGGIARGLGATPLRVGGVEDHVHLIVGAKPAMSPADLVRDLKRESGKWVRDIIGPDFAWQEGYGGFSVSRWDVERVIEYIANQEEHHRRVTFQEEYLAFLGEQGVAFDPRYLW